jgi:hypothetical protein
MKSILLPTLGMLVTLSLTGCVTESYETLGANGYGEMTPGIVYTRNYDNYTRADSYPDSSGGGFYSYGGRYTGGGYGYGDPFNH